MKSDCIVLQLVTESCTFNFHLKLACLKNKLYEFDVEVLLAPKFKGYLPRNFYCRFYRQDLYQISRYFWEHYHKLIATDGWYESPKIVNSIDMNFYVQCHEGDVESIENGAFNITISINCGAPFERGTNTSFGITSFLSTLNMRNFCDDLKKLAELTNEEFGALACRDC